MVVIILVIVGSLDNLATYRARDHTCPHGQVLPEDLVILEDVLGLLAPTALIDMVVMMVVAVLVAHAGPASSVAVVAQMVPMLTAIQVVVTARVAAVTAVQTILMALSPMSQTVVV